MKTRMSLGEEERFTAQEIADRAYGDKALCLDIAYRLVALEEMNARLEEQLEMDGRRLEIAIRAMGPVPETGSVLGVAVRRVLPGILFFVGGMAAFVALFLVVSSTRPGWCLPEGAGTGTGRVEGVR